ncbi:MAG: hypothetical protein FJW26_08015 [Acidimicrobiia bacterium]|nr:hypothetical protein [Acidimicrobiia bacterium]
MYADSFFISKNAGGLFSRIPYRNPISWPFYKVWPRNSLIGFQAQERADLLAGANGNLVYSVPTDTEGKQRHSEVNATIAQFRCGKGRLIVSTFEVVAPSMDDPVAAIMLANLVGYAGTSFQPNREFLL